jgi:anti-sigma-K factor RskA
MADVDAFAEAEHQDAAGWALGILDPEDRKRFVTHLYSCPECQQAVADLRPAALMLKTPLPAVELTAGAEPPADLEARTLASVKRAARKATGRRWNTRLPLAAAAAAAIVAAVAGVVLTLARPAPALAVDIPLHALYGGPASGEAVAHQTANGWSIQLTVHDLKPLGSGRFYECWYAGPGNQSDHPDLITAGTFTIGPSGTATVEMWSAADPRTFPTMQITAEQAGDAGQHGQIILTGTTRE